MRSLIFILSMLVISSHAQTTNKGTIKVKKEVKTPAVSAPLTVVEKMPEFPGGNVALFSFVQANLKYPQSAIENGLSGTCVITFVVEPDGQLSGVRVLRGIAGCPECDQEALRVIMLMPNWKPGQNKGKTVRVQFNLPIKFSLK